MHVHPCRMSRWPSRRSWKRSSKVTSNSQSRNRSLKFGIRNSIKMNSSALPSALASPMACCASARCNISTSSAEGAFEASSSICSIFNFSMSRFNIASHVSRGAGRRGIITNICCLRWFPSTCTRLGSCRDDAGTTGVAGCSAKSASSMSVSTRTPSLSMVAQTVPGQASDERRNEVQKNIFTGTLGRTSSLRGCATLAFGRGGGARGGKQPLPEPFPDVISGLQEVSPDCAGGGVAGRGEA
mmetsp:Transcript_78767/g.218943  ORF Transcript_78767/g.218943 Transcript_78767/m.218943 type:complete len:242 (-) Transcript_78767:748-1473(-)